MRLLSKFAAVLLALLTIQFSPLAANAAVVQNTANGNYYQFVAGAVSQDAAAYAAAKATNNGVQGHLVTIGDAAENAYVLSLTGGARIWLGARVVTPATGIDYTWFVGPDAGTYVTSCVDGHASCTNTAAYNNWDAATAQPDGVKAGLEPAVAMFSKGTWSDCAISGTACAVAGYVIEFETPGSGGTGGGTGGGSGSAPVPTITGDPAIGSTLTVDPGIWDNTTLDFQWYSCGTAVSGANTDTYVTTDLDASCDVYVDVTGTFGGVTGVTYSSATFTVAAAGGGVPMDAPVVAITGDPVVLETLTADSSLWPQDIALSYQWMLDGTNIDGATAATYTLQPGDGGHSITVSITAALDGFNDVTGTSDPLDVSLASLTLTPTPVIKGTAKVGKTLSITRGNWDSGVAFSYQWYIDSDPVDGATDATFVLPAASVNVDVFVEVTGSKLGFNSATMPSDPVTIAPGTLVKTPVPTIAGTPKVGQKLTATEKVWDDGVTFEYEWSAGGKVIAGATERTFAPTAAQLGKTITVKVTGSLDGYTPVSKTSAASAKVGLGVITVAATPVIVGALKNGKSVTVDTGVWVDGAKFTVVWLLDGKPIKGAKGNKLSIAKTAKGHKLSVSVTGVAPGYAPLTKVSKPVKVG